LFYIVKLAANSFRQTPQIKNFWKIYCLSYGELMSAKILLIDNDASSQIYLNQYLEKEGFQVFLANNGEIGKFLCEKNNPDLILLDIPKTTNSNHDFFDYLHDRNSPIPVIIQTAFPNLKGAVKLLKKGAIDYLVKPFDFHELKKQIEKTLQQINTPILKALPIKISSNHVSKKLPTLIGESSQLVHVRQLIKKVAPSSSTVFVTGESGTGKELVASAIHHYSKRKHQPFIAVNCSAIPENLLETELFGYEKGSFTGADTQKKGLFEVASGGTLFLDEIGELPLSLQPKLLRVLESLSIKRIGGKKEISVDVRIIAASNRDFQEQIDLGEFRKDLFYRLNVIPIHLASLHTIKEDIPKIANYLLDSYQDKFSLNQVNGFSTQTLELLTAWSWPGNVRELKNVIERIVIIHQEDATLQLIQPEMLPIEIQNGTNKDSISTNSQELSTPQEKILSTLEEVEKFHILHVLQKCLNNKSETARYLGITRNTLKAKLKKYQL
jgi:DNA-binding NtrC family response regulator